MKSKKTTKKNKKTPKVPDENSFLLIYGNLKITDKTTGQVLVNKRV